MGKVVYVLLALFMLVMVSCEEERNACLQPKTVTLRVGCYTLDSGNVVIDTALPNAIIAGLFADSVKGWIVGADNLQGFPLLLSASDDSCQWVIRADSSVARQDTLTFLYSRRLQFLSNACGYTYFFSIRDIRTTRNSIDSVIITNPEVSTNANVEHVRLYF